MFKRDNFNNAEPVKNGENATLDELIENYEKQIIIQAVEECGTLTAAAQKLNVNKSTISRKLKKYGY